MPRYTNLKGSMNPFDNNKPVLSSSERLKNKRDVTIYQTAKQQFQTKRLSNNMRFYGNGTIRSTISYKMNLELSRGAVLSKKQTGASCKNIFDKNDMAKINMGNNIISTLNLGNGIGGSLINPTNIGKNVIINSDISGTWGGSVDISKSLIGPDAMLNTNIPMPYGYVNNLIKVPRNLNGTGVVLDPSNILFTMDDRCNANVTPNYMKMASLKTFIIYEGPISTGLQYLQFGNAVNNTTFASLVNLYCQFTFNLVDFDDLENALPTGQVSKICPIGSRITNDTLFGTPYFPVDIFRVYIEITNFQNSKLWQGIIFPDKTNFTPQFKPNTIPNFQIRGFNVQNPTTSAFSIHSDWAAIWDPGFGKNNNGGGISMKVSIDQNSELCDMSQGRGNTKQSYMHGLEDKTTRIKLN